MRLFALTVGEAIAGLKQKKFSAQELVAACLVRIDEVDSKIRAFVTVDKEGAMEASGKADETIANLGANAWKTKPLLGVPVAVKDNFSTAGLRTTASAKVLEDYVPPYDATVVARLKDAGAIILGKTNMDAWAHGSSTEYSDFFTTKNPWDLGRLPGGSSGGSAAAVAADETIVAVGSETAGSIRQPAAWCGVTGFKPTYGRVSRYGLIAMASSLDSPGPIAKNVEDAQLVLAAISGGDKLDATTIAEEKIKFSKNGETKKLKIGVPRSYFEGVDKDVAKTVEAALKELEKLGASLHSIELLSPKYSIACYTLIMRAEVSSNLARYDGIRFGRDRSYFGDEARRRIMLGTHALSFGYYDQYYVKAQKVRSLILKDFQKAFGKVDVIVSPTSPSVALPVGATAGQFMFGELQDVLTEPSALAGLPAISIPCGFAKNLPVGLQIIGPQKQETVVAQVAQSFQGISDWHKRKPKL